MKKVFWLSMVLVSPFLLSGQESGVVTVFGGRGVAPAQVMVSDQANLVDGVVETGAGSAMNGMGMDGQWYEMGRLMRQATLGVTRKQMEVAATMTPEEWIDWQMGLPMVDFQEFTFDKMQENRDYAQLLNAVNYFPPSDNAYAKEEFKMAWYDYNLTSNELLRDKVMQVYSQIFVISSEPEDLVFARGLSAYSDMLRKNAFGNFRDLLLDVSLHPAMGAYLNHLNNPKANMALNIFPDENYAREVMQLFSIGLLKLNPDGSYMLDEEGNTIPTYNQSVIKNMARVFTGLSASEPCYYDDLRCDQDNYGPAWFGLDRWTINYSYPMKMYMEYHDRGEKIIFDGHRIPPGQSGIKDIEMTIDYLFRHPNVGPFIGKQLIQKMVTSNPSSEYVADITAIFNNNGQGVRGDMGAVIKAILLHPEARDCSSLTKETHGKLQEPLIRYFEYLKLLDIIPDKNGKIFFNNWYQEAMGQDIYSSPSVFNFFRPDYKPTGMISEAGLVGGEFQMHNSFSALEYLSEFERMTLQGRTTSLHWMFNKPWEVYLTDDRSKLYRYARDPEAYINYLNRYFFKGGMSRETHDIMKTMFLEIGDFFSTSVDRRVNTGLMLTTMSPDFTILK
jgi:uncharacterized protein (DUF1800 family)